MAETFISIIGILTTLGDGSEMTNPRLFCSLSSVFASSVIVKEMFRFCTYAYIAQMHSFNDLSIIAVAQLDAFTATC